MQKIALITGAASGMGLATARAFAASGSGLLLVDRNPEIETIAAEFAGQVPSHGLVADLKLESDIERLARTIRSRYQKLDILVNNAGIHPKKNGGKPLITDITTEEWNTVLAVNLTAPFLLFRELFGLLAAGGNGRVVNVSSRAGRSSSPAAAAHYAATKTGLIGLTRVMALEGAPRGITANCVAPGPVMTGLTTTTSEEMRAVLARSVPLGRYGKPEEIATVIAFLASEAASFVTGAVFDINGGSHMP